MRVCQSLSLSFSLKPSSGKIKANDRESFFMTDTDAENQAAAGAPSPAEARLACLQGVALALSAALTVPEVAEVIISAGLRALGGNAGSVSLLSEDGAEFETIQCFGYPPDVVAAYARYPVHTALPNADAVRTGQPLFLETGAEREQRYPHLKGNALRGGRGAQAALPLVVHGRVLGGLAVSFPEDRSFTPDDRAFLATIGQLCAQSMERARLYDAACREIAQREQSEQLLREAGQRQRELLRDVLFNVTQGHLILCDTQADLPVLGTPFGDVIALSWDDGLRTLRHMARDAALAEGLSEQQVIDLVSAVGEAAMNAIVHVGSGEGRVFISPGSPAVQVRIIDHGSGIALEHLPAATLRQGFTTAGTLGRGMKMMLQMADRVFLLTNPTGTIVILEQERTPPSSL